MCCVGSIATVKNKLSSIYGVKSIKSDFGKKQADIETSYEISIYKLQS